MAEHPSNAYTCHHDSDGSQTEEATLLPLTTHSCTQLQQPNLALDAIFPLNGLELSGTLRGAQLGPTDYQHSYQSNGDVLDWDPDFDNLVDFDPDHLHHPGVSFFNQTCTNSSTNSPDADLGFGFHGSQLGQAGTTNDINADGSQQGAVGYHTTALAPTIVAPDVPAPTTAMIDCTYCGKKFGRPSEMRRHAKKHLPPGLKCDIEDCGKAFYRKDKLRDHRAKGHKSSRYRCVFDGCKMTFFNMEELRGHLRNGHGGVNPLGI
ncbi:hypothetical protein CFE70_003961 [Pyrenophora teres f. teres 0-1]|uniref:Zinc finger protein n=1 Tax=Pyrenophora teres f. teres TaxID=97479 RepID=A0A6S6VYS6_9PLEO|nr:hypothetical protein HRS9139_00133 [Pyrenophora teres f. teres]KAE8847704.1 hypothetical protein PTNB85_01547 [Pyrenophora teres f. teres]KAE8854139.1 hypothetical protein HRS9122_01131 [Pyrenophora teres f. teres]KAE8867631.1 hypothetical protein PTNB29_01542 [Pyrenophora teres f. teres]KAE8872399.1 hypothetical protein PTNB73_01550 [Pyrenophora teres f. teres]